MDSLSLLSLFRGRGFLSGLVRPPFQTVAPSRDGEDLGPAQEAVKNGCGRGNIADQKTPVFQGAVGGHEGGAKLEAAHDDLEQMLPAMPGKVLESHVVDDQEIRSQILPEDLVPLLKGLGLHEFRDRIKNGAVQDTEAHAGILVSQRLDKMGLPHAGRSAEEHIALFLQDVARGQIEETFLVIDRRRSNRCE